MAVHGSKPSQMDADPIIEELRSRSDEIRDRYSVRSLLAFGSLARGELTEGSDVDLLVEFEGPATFDRFMDLKFYLEDALDRPVDLVTKKALRPALSTTVEREGVHVA